MRWSGRWSVRLAGLVCALSLTAPAQAEPEKCPRMVAEMPKVWRAAYRPVAAEANAVQLTFVGHATFLIESPKGVTIATDYNDYVRPRKCPSSSP